MSGTTPTAPLRTCHDCWDVTRTTLSRCEPCRKKRRPQDRKRRRAISRAIFPIALRAEVLRLLRRGRGFTAVAQELQVPAPQIHAFAKINPAFRADLDKALMAGRDESLKHGSTTTYRVHGCRCPECRRAKRKAGAWKRPAKAMA